MSIFRILSFQFDVSDAVDTDVVVAIAVACTVAGFLLPPNPRIPMDE